MTQLERFVAHVIWIEDSSRMTVGHLSSEENGLLAYVRLPEPCFYPNSQHFGNHGWLELLFRTFLLTQQLLIVIPALQHFGCPLCRAQMDRQGKESGVHQVLIYGCSDSLASFMSPVGETKRRFPAALTTC